MLCKIIELEGLGEVVGEKEDGLNAEMSILQSKASIILLDLLMPHQSGLEVVENLRRRGFSGRFIMLSQVESKELVAQAYSVGVEFFIHKPINRIEVVSVINKVLEQVRLRESLDRVRESLSWIEGIPSKKISPQLDGRTKIREKTLEILGDLGILGEAGSKDLVQIMQVLAQTLSFDEAQFEIRSLKELYNRVSLEQSNPDKFDAQAMEQRIRRAIRQGMENIAALGVEDYHDPKFERFASKFFDFIELRRKMREIENGEPNKVSPRINIRKFIEAMAAEIILQR
jgi:two-component system, response regulator YcbB